MGGVAISCQVVFISQIRLETKGKSTEFLCSDCLDT